MLGIGIDESTAILVDVPKIKVIGDSQVIVISNPTKSKKRYKEKIGAEGLQLDIYLPEAVFNIDN